MASPAARQSGTVVSGGCGNRTRRGCVQRLTGAPAHPPARSADRPCYQHGKRGRTLPGFRPPAAELGSARGASSCHGLPPAPFAAGTAADPAGKGAPVSRHTPGRTDLIGGFFFLARYLSAALT